MTDIFISTLVDRSGSMNRIWQDTLGGLETFRKEQVEQPGTTWFSLFGFDAPRFNTPQVQIWNGISTPAFPRQLTESDPSWFTPVYEAWNANDVPDLNNLTEIAPRGATALLDAIGETVQRTEQLLADRPWFNGTVMLIVQTDGYENSSSKYTTSQIKDLIGKKEAEGWQVVFMGAGIDAIAEGQGIGMQAGNSYSYTPDSYGTKTAYSTLAGNTSALRSAGGQSVSNFWEQSETAD